MPPKKKSQEVEDIFAETDRTPKSTARSAVRPKRQLTPAQVAPAVPLPMSKQVPQIKKSRTMLIMLVTVAAIVVVGSGAALVSFGYFTNNNENDNANTVDAGETNSNVTTVPVRAVIDTNVEPLPPVEDTSGDRDGDGLTDAEELELGTDPARQDTDGDGLFDREETTVYETDPLDPDTDGDGHTDGDEVATGYDPSGTGMLRNVNASISEL